MKPIRIIVTSETTGEGVKKAKKEVSGLGEETKKSSSKSVSAWKKLDAGTDSLSKKMKSLTSNVGRASGILAAISASSGLAATGVLAATAASAAMPGVLAAGAAAMGTYRLGMTGISDAMALIGEDSKKFNEGIKELAPSAQATLVQIRSMKGEFQSLRNSVQQKLFQGMDAEMKNLSPLMSSVRAPMQDMASSLNGVAKSFLHTATSASNIRAIRTVIDNAAIGVKNFAQGIPSITDGIIKLAATSSGFFPRLGKWIGSAVGYLGELMQKASEGNRLESIWTLAGNAMRGMWENMQPAVKGIQDVVSAAGGLGPAFQASITGGGGIFAGSMQAIGDILTTLASIISGLAPVINAVAPTLAAFGPTIGYISMMVKAWTMAQGALNVVLAANPIGLIVLAIAGLGAALVVAYNKSQTFRTIVDGAFHAVAAAASYAYNFIKNNWKLLLLALTGPIGVAAIVVIKNFDKIKGAASAVVNFVKSHWKSILGVITGPIGTAVIFVVSNFGKISAAAKAVPGKIKSAFSGAGSWLKSAGKSVIDGLWSGIAGSAGWLASKVKSFATDTVLGSMKSALGIASPSKKGRAFGQNFVNSISLGMFDTTGEISSATRKLVSIIDKNMAGRKQSSLTAYVQREASTLMSLARQRASLADKIKSATAKLDEAIKIRGEYSSQIRSSLVSSASLSSYAQEAGSASSGAGYEAYLRERLNAIKKFQTDLARLTKMGASKDLIKQLAESGVDSAGALASSLAAGSKSSISTINKLNAQIYNASAKTGTQVAGTLYDSGVAAARGLVSGLQKEQKSIEAMMLKIAKGMRSALRKALGIASPSKIMAQEGRSSADGVAQGLLDRIPQVRAATTRLAGVIPDTATRTSASAAGGQGPTVPASTAAPIVLRVDLTGADASFLTWLRRSIRIQGGDVQVVLGS